MVIVGRKVLDRAGRRHAGLGGWLKVWLAVAEAAQWGSLADVRRQYPTADGVKLRSGLVVTVFNVKGNSYRLLTWVDYQSEVVEVLAVLSHAEYDKESWKGWK